MRDAATLWLHILAVTVWVGPQFFLFLAAIPAVRTIEDAQQRTKVLRVMVNRFGWIGLAALAVIIVTGIGNVLNVDDKTPPGQDLFDFGYRWANVFAAKMSLVAIMLALTLVHTFVIGPKQIELSERAESNPRDLARLRGASIALSSVVLVASVAIIFLAALLANHEWSFQPT